MTNAQRIAIRQGRKWAREHHGEAHRDFDVCAESGIPVFADLHRARSSHERAVR